MATSTDGLNWEKPKLGAVEYEGSKDNNIVMSGFPSYPGGTVMYDPHDPNAQMRYKFMTNFGVDDKEGTPWTEGLVIQLRPTAFTSPNRRFRFFHTWETLRPFFSNTIVCCGCIIGKYIFQTSRITS
jgi:hypothetical protein